MNLKKIAIVVFLLAGLIFLSLHGFSQDTFPTKKVLVATVLLDRKTCRVIHTWYRKVTVKKGYIIKRPDGLFIINGKVMIPNNFSYVPYPTIVADIPASIKNPKKQ